MKCMVLLLVQLLASRSKEDKEANEHEDDNEEKVVSDLDVLAISLPPAVAASALWIMGEWIALCPRHKFSLARWTI